LVQVFGGVGVGLTSCPLTAQYLTGKAVNAATLAGALPLLQQVRCALYGAWLILGTDQVLPVSVGMYPTRGSD